MAMVCLENLWLGKLESLHWPKSVSECFKHFLAQSTLEQYNTYVNKYRRFCLENYCTFPPKYELRQASVASFLHSIALTSQRPQSMIKMAWSAIVHYYEAINHDIKCTNLYHLMHAIVKCHTKAPQGRTPVPDIAPIISLFETWGPNEALSDEKLRQKCVSLLCLTAMCRPSDLAPRVGFHRNQIVFNKDGSATVTFFGIKNDADRKGFEIKLSPTSEKISDPVKCLRNYLDRTSAAGCL